MVVIRLARVGKKHEPIYRITVADSRRYVTGKFLEIIGTYKPTPRGQEKKFTLDADKAKAWIAKGAQPTDTVKHVLRLAGVDVKAAAKSTKIKKAPKAKPAAAKA